MIWDVVVVHSNFDQTVGDGSICITAVEPENCEVVFPLLCFLHKLAKGPRVLQASSEPFNALFLDGGVNISILGHTYMQSFF